MVLSYDEEGFSEYELDLLCEQMDKVGMLIQACKSSLSVMENRLIERGVDFPDEVAV